MLPSSVFSIMIRRPPRSTLFPSRRSSDLSSTRSKDGEVTETWGNADYLELTVAGTTNRYEKYKQDEKYALRNCLVNKTLSEDEQEKQKICRASETVLEDFSVINDLIYSEEKYFSNFAIPAYGSYKRSEERRVGKECRS